MTVARAADRPADDRDRLDRLEQVVADLQERVARLERPRAIRRRLRDEHDLVVFRALVPEVGITRISAKAVIEHARACAPKLLAALTAADCDASTKSLGRLFGRLENRPIDGLMLVRAGEGKWRIVPA
jgi:hypothetical protein